MEIFFSNKIFFCNKFLHHSNLLLSPYSTQFHLNSNSPKAPVFLQPFNRNRSSDSNTTILCSTSGSNSTTYGGWEDFNFVDDSKHSSEFHQFQHFLASLGIDDTKHVFTFILGFMAAFAISRVRVSSILLFPASVLIFSVGFSLGFVHRGGPGFSVRESSEKASKDEIFKFSADKLRHLEALFIGLTVKITNLEKGMTGDLGLNQVHGAEFEFYLGAIKSLSLDIYHAKTVIEAAINDVGESKGESVEEGQAERNLNQKMSRRKRDSGAGLLDIFQLIGGLFQEGASATKPNKVKDILKRESLEPMNSNTTSHQFADSVSSGGEEEVMSVNSELESERSNNVIDPSLPEASRNQASSQHGAEVTVNGSRKVVEGVMNGNSRPVRNETQTFSSSKDLSNRNYGSQFTDNSGSFTNIKHEDEENIVMPHNDLCTSLNFSVDMISGDIDVEPFTLDSEVSNRYHVPKRKMNENGRYKFDFVERKERSGDPPNPGSQEKAPELEEDSASSLISEDLVFNKHLTEATDLLKGARECLKGKADEDRAEFMLYKSARLLSEAAAMKPMSLLAVGQLGNTYLLHGELKLRVSRELRNILSRNEPSRGKRPVALKALAEQNMNKDEIASILVDVCEECEGLLVEAGRQYKMALSIDGSDVRALYNWGLALSYRAQLIADVGPEAASDADKVYLAAIDKFNAMMSRNKAYAPDALFRWGVALQQRSRLRPSNTKEKLKLLYQAKSLFEDALSMNSNNGQVREALMSCISELNYKRF